MDTILGSNVPTPFLARKVVFAKGIFDIFLSLSLILFPSLLYSGPLTALISWMTGLPQANWSEDTQSAYGLAALIMGCAFAGITAGSSLSPDAHKTVAALNGVFAATGLIGCLLSRDQFGSSFLLLASLQDVLWTFAIMRAGGFNIVEILGFYGQKTKETAEQVRNGTGDALRQINSNAPIDLKKLNPL